MPAPFIHPERRLNRGGALNAYDDDLPVLYSAGIRAVVSLLNAPSDAAAYESIGFNFLCLPVLDGAAPDLKQASEFVRFVEDNRAAQRPVAVHCAAGVGRTGTMLAMYLITKGETAGEAIHHVRAVQPRAVETPRQMRFLEEFATLLR